MLNSFEDEDAEQRHPKRSRIESPNRKCFITSSNKKNGIMLVAEGFLFNLNKKVEKSKSFYWDCNRRKHSKKELLGIHSCNSKAVTTLVDGAHVLKSMMEHTHAAEAVEYAVKSARNEVKTKAESSRAKSCQVIQDILAELPKNCKPNMPAKPALRKTISRQRRKELPTEPTDIQSLNIPDSLKSTFSGELFLLKESTVGEQKILLFSTKTNIRLLAQSRIIIGDGTFKTVPGLFTQLYSMHGEIGLTNAIIEPLVYSLMTSKSGECYDRLIQDLNDLADEYECEISPKFIVTDFEIGAINAFKKEYPNAKQKGCFFHLGQSIYRKIQKLGLSTKYGEDIEFSLQVRQIYALAFLEPKDIPDAFKELQKSLSSDLTEFGKWFEENYVLGRIRQKRKRTRRSSLEMRTPPLFPPELWSILGNTKDGLPKTSNKAEAWHRRWNTLVQNTHVGTLFFINEMRKEQEQVVGEIERMVAGVAPPHKKKKQIERESRIAMVLNDLGKKPILESLKGLAYNLSF